MRIPWISAPSSSEQLTSSPAGSSTSAAATAATITHTSPPISAVSHPTSLSCRDIFDRAFFCQSPAGQFLSVYRYSQLRSCSDLWDDLRFCMRNNYSGAPAWAEDKSAAGNEIATRFAKREYETYRAPGQKSSDDVWSERTVDERLQRAWDIVPPHE